MTRPYRYREDARQVRLRARAHIIALREERMKRRGGANAVIGTQDSWSEATRDGGLARAFEECAATEESTVVEQGPDMPIQPDHESCRDDMTHGIALSDEDGSPKTADRDTEAHIIETTENAPPETDGEPVASDDTFVEAPEVEMQNELFTLPGAGAGIVWMLTQCGVSSLNDLASANAGELQERLGIVGRLINLEPWIEFAKGQKGGENV